MSNLAFKFKKTIFLGKLQGIGNYNLWQVLKTLLKIIKLRGWGAVFSYLRFVIFSKKPMLKTLPFVMVCYIDSRCNLKCPYCCFGLSEGSHLRNQYDFQEILSCRDTNFGDFKRLAGQPVFKNALTLVLSGGEPLLNPDFFKIAEYAKEYFPLIHLTTNGTLLGSFLEKIVDSGLTHINISLDASDEEEYKKMRFDEGGEEIFRKVTANIKTLADVKKKKKSDLQILVSFVVGKLNYKKMGEMINLAISLGADSVNFQNICGFNCAALAQQTITVEDKEIIEFIGELKKKYSGFHVIYPRVVTANKNIRGCRQCFDSLTVDADGNVGPCSVIVPKPSSEYGNLFAEAEVWNNQAYQKLRES